MAFSLREQGANSGLKEQFKSQVIFKTLTLLFLLTFCVVDGNNMNKQGVFTDTIGICSGPLGNIFVLDQGKGTVLKVRVSHYPALVDSVLTRLSTPLGLIYGGGVLYVTEKEKTQVIV